MIGPFINGAAVVSGSVLGALLGSRLPVNLRKNLPKVFGCTSMGLGIVMTMKVQTLPAVVLALLIGSIIGELLHIETVIHRASTRLRAGIEKIFPGPETDISHDEFMEKFVSLLVLFCISGMGVFGSMNEGITGDPTLLIVKSFLDFLTACIFATSLGFTLAAVAIPQTLIQCALYWGAAVIMPLTTPVMIADFSAVGGLVMFATGFRICGMMSFPIANMLPALFIAMPVSYFWGLFAGQLAF